MDAMRVSLATKVSIHHQSETARRQQRFTPFAQKEQTNNKQQREGVVAEKKPLATHRADVQGLSNEENDKKITWYAHDDIVRMMATTGSFSIVMNQTI